MKIALPLHGQRITIRNCCSADLPFLTQMWFDEDNGHSYDIGYYAAAAEPLSEISHGNMLRQLYLRPDFAVTTLLFPLNAVR